jgi:hypothetical protein
MLLQLLQRYSLKLVFVLGLLIGLQLPNFLQQYEHRLDAHYQEAKRQLQQYQDLAELYFQGDLSALLIEHEKSTVELFRTEAKVIEKLQKRVDYLQEKKNTLQGPLVNRLYFLVTELSSPIMLETKENYNAEIALNRDSIVVGITLALICTLSLELLFFVIAYQARRLPSLSSLKKRYRNNSGG